MNYRKATARAVVMENDAIEQPASPFAGSSLVPMLAIGLVLTFAGTMAALLLS